MKVLNHIFVTEKAAVVENKRAVLSIISLERSLRGLIEHVLEKYPRNNEAMSVLCDTYKRILEDHRLSTEDIHQYRRVTAPCYWETEDKDVNGEW